jgi:hypothetical protein
MKQRKQLIILLFAVLSFFIILFSSRDISSLQLQPPTGFANNPPGPFNTGPLSCVYCHTGVPHHDSTNFILEMGVDTSSLATVISGLTTYRPGETYMMRVTGTRHSVVYGFELTAEDTLTNGANVGNFALLDTVNTSENTSAGCTYMGHHNASSVNQWTFTWTAPAEAAYEGKIIFYYVGNDGSGPSNNQPSCCDSIFVVTKTISWDGLSAINPIDSRISGLLVFPSVSAQDFQVSFNLKENAKVGMEIVAMTGQVVKTLLNENLGEGHFNRSFNMESLAAGIYMIKLNVGDAYVVRKIVKE